VATSEIGTFCSSHTYVVYASSEPNVTRYSNATQERPLTAARSRWPNSPVSPPATRHAVPPAAISQTEATKGSRGSRPRSDSRPDSTEPVAQLRLATRMISTPAEAAPPVDEPGSARTTSPAKPTRTPATVAAGARSPRPNLSTTTHSGTEATSSAARPEGTVCSPRTTPPLPPSSSSVPTAAAPASCRRFTRSAPRPRRSRSTTPSTAAATTNRAPAESRPGMVSTVTRIAR
jgi:hypothetical protein